MSGRAGATSAADGDTGRSPRVRHEVIWAPLAGLAILAAAFLPLDRLPLGPCPFHALTGLPCPSCGGTRAFQAAARLEILEALTMNPVAGMLAIAGAAYVVHALGVWLRGWPPWRPTVAAPRWRRRLRAAAWATLALNWAYLIAAGR